MAIRLRCQTQQLARDGNMADQTIDIHIATLKMLDAELERLHGDLANGDGDSDLIQSQISAIINQLNSLSLMLGEHAIS